MRILNKIWHGLVFPVFYLYNLVLANLRLAKDVLTPSLDAQPGIIEIDLQVKTDRQILILTNLITMTPGTLTLYISDDHKKIFVHGMYIKDEEEFIANIKQLEKRLLQLTG